MSGENPKTTTNTVSDRFDLEQEILECWRVVEDIKMCVTQNSGTDDLLVLSSYYEMKFNKLWTTFENLVNAKKLT
jgi:hypothetical protein